MTADAARRPITTVLLLLGRDWTRIGVWLFKGGSVLLLQRRHPLF